MRQEFKDLFHYAEGQTSNPSQVLRDLERKTHLRTVSPQMCSGRLQGRLLSMLSKIVRPAEILEIGTFTGYGTLCLAEGLLPGGKLHTIESNGEPLVIAREAFALSEYNDQIVIHQGDALRLLPRMSQTWDMVYLDGAKRQYLEYYALVMDRMKSGGLLLADNVLWGGQVLGGRQTEESAILDAFNTQVLEDERLENVLLPLRDGLMICRKI